MIRHALTHSRSARATFTTLAGWARTIIATLVGFVVTPILLRSLGNERLGIVRMSDQWFAYLEFMTFGLGPALAVLLTRTASHGTEDDIRAATWAGLRLMARQVRWLLPSLIGLILLFPCFVEMTPELRREYYLASPAFALGAVMMPLAVFRSAISAQQRGYMLNVAMTAQVITSAVLAICFAKLGFGVAGQAWSNVLGNLTMHGVLVVALGLLPGRGGNLPQAVISQQELSRWKWPLLFAGVANQLSLLSDNLMAGLLLTVADVMPFVITQRLLQSMITFASAFSHAGSWAGLVDLRARVGQNAFAERVAELSKLNLGSILLVLAPVAGYNQRFVTLWVGAGLYARNGNLLTLATYLQLSTFGFLCLFSALIDTFGDTRKRVSISVVGTIIKLCLMAPLCWWLGPAGLPLATTVGYWSTDGWCCPWIVCREYQVSGRAILSGLWRSVLVAGPWLAVCYLLGTRTDYLYPEWLEAYSQSLAWPKLPKWFTLLSELGLMEIGSIVIGWQFLLMPEDRDIWRRRVLSWVHAEAPPATAVATSGTLPDAELPAMPQSETSE